MSPESYTTTSPSIVKLNTRLSNGGRDHEKKLVRTDLHLGLLLGLIHPPVDHRCGGGKAACRWPTSFDLSPISSLTGREEPTRLRCRHNEL